MNQNKLMQEFPPVSTAEWEKAIQEDLKGADYEKKLVWKTWEEISVKPYYRSEDLKGLQWLLTALPGEYPYVRGNRKSKNDWEIRAEIFDVDIAKANAMALRNLERGCDALAFSSRIRDGKLFGQNVQQQSDFNRLLEKVDLKRVPLHLDFGSRAAQALAFLLNYTEARGVSPQGSLLYDPIAELLLAGKLDYCKNGWKKSVAELAKYAVQYAPRIQPITVQTHPIHNAGGTIVQEMAYALGAGIEYLDALTDAGMSGSQAAQLIGFSFSVGSNYFFEIARMRAFRLLWAAILKDYGAAEVKPRIHARTSVWNATIFDPNVNMLRATTEAMSAVLGGCDALTVVPYDAVFRIPDEFSYRIARNTQLILKYEAFFERIVDPAAGSYYVESITNALVEKALELLKTWERKDGLMQAVLAGSVQKDVAEVQSKKDKAITSRREVFLGTNMFPNFTETMSAHIEIPEGMPLSGKIEDCPCTDVDWYRKEFSTTCCAHCGCEGDSCCGDSAKDVLQATALQVRRGAEVFEKMRLRTEAYAAKTGSAPKVFLWTAGNLAMRLARATFVKNFFGCAGFISVDTNGIKNAEEGLALAQPHQPQIFVLCSKDEEYLALAQSVVPAIRQAHPKALVIVAGYPEEQIDALKAAGVDDFVHIRTNAVDFLLNYQAKLGVN